MVEETFIAVPVRWTRRPIRTASNSASVCKGDPTDRRCCFWMGSISRINGGGRFLDLRKAASKEVVKIETDRLVKVQAP